MLRTTLGALVGAILTVVIVAAGSIAAGTFLGESFYEVRDDVLHASLNACAIVLAVGFVAAIIGGFVATLIGRSWMPVVVLVLLTIVFGGLVAFRGIQMEPKKLEGRSELITGMQITFEETGEVGELAEYLAQPAWYLIGNPVAGVLGLFIGGSIAPKGRRSDS